MHCVPSYVLIEYAFGLKVETKYVERASLLWHRLTSRRFGKAEH